MVLEANRELAEEELKGIEVIREPLALVAWNGIRIVLVTILCLNNTFANYFAKLVLGVPTGGAKHQLGPWIGGSMPSWGLTKSAKVLVEIRCNIIFEAVPWPTPPIF